MSSERERQFFAPSYDQVLAAMKYDLVLPLKAWNYSGVAGRNARGAHRFVDVEVISVNKLNDATLDRCFTFECRPLEADQVWTVLAYAGALKGININSVQGCDVTNVFVPPSPIKI